ncbi:uncharacterized protein LOC112271813 isoform X2 [Brachypodium distachyon]|uniref:uncharacterized protein LOC112271813 isoform X2 n=1 Tax=Brachypodium distachyon TaxID=15368 RepID=UPI000D0DA7D7|nr:uncharacterized protein LOC112271813 isoform X2 [Brachypodium distachyon]|eukprot:XP_024317764.1 uncharacterized protein LOC112271813 isoform X2 [Brachypodium distachyon]
MEAVFAKQREEMANLLESHCNDILASAKLYCNVREVLDKGPSRTDKGMFNEYEHHGSSIPAGDDVLATPPAQTRPEAVVLNRGDSRAHRDTAMMLDHAVPVIMDNTMVANPNIETSGVPANVRTEELAYATVPVQRRSAVLQRLSNNNSPANPRGSIVITLPNNICDQVDSMYAFVYMHAAAQQLNKVWINIPVPGEPSIELTGLKFRAAVIGREDYDVDMMKATTALLNELENKASSQFYSREGTSCLQIGLMCVHPTDGTHQSGLLRTCSWVWASPMTLHLATR